MIIYRQKLFTSEQLARRARLERGKRNIRFLGGVAKNTSKRFGRQLVDMAKNPFKTTADVGKGVVTDNINGLTEFGKTAAATLNPTNMGKVPLSKKIRFAGTFAAATTFPAAFGFINSYDTAMHVAGKKGKDVVESLANLQTNPHSYLGQHVDIVRKTRVGTLGSGSVQGAIGGKWLGTNELASIAGKTNLDVGDKVAGNVTGYNIGITPGQVMRHAGNSWANRTKLDLAGEKANLMNSKDARGFAWWYDRKVGSKLNKVADANGKLMGKVSGKVDSAGAAVSSKLKSAGSVLSGIFKGRGKAAPAMRPIPVTA